MKYKIGDKVRIKRGLEAHHRYGNNSYVSAMDRVAKDNDYILTIRGYNSTLTQYTMDEDKDCWLWTDEMIEGLVEPTDREKFEGWMRKLSSLEYDNDVWNAFNYLVATEPNEKGYENKLKIVSDFLFAKKMTKAEIEAELGYSIEIVEE